jgi:acyl dehydratase
VTASRDTTEATDYPLTDEDVERAQLLVGRSVANVNHEAFTVASYDAIRMFTRSTGDDNPLYCDAQYGSTTRWGSQIAPGTFLRNINMPLEGSQLPEDVKLRTRSLFKGVHAFLSGSGWSWYRPLYPGERVHSYSFVDDVSLRSSSFAERAAYVRRVEVKFTDGGDVLASRESLMIHSERRKAAERGKYSGVEFVPYTDAEIEHIDALYRNESPRGSSTRYIEDVEVGESIGRLVKGPLTVSEVIAFHAGGYGLYPFLTASRLAWKNRQRFPAFYVKNPDGVPELAQRVHWDNEWAAAIGSPRAYDYGYMRQCWLFHFLSDWCGDDGFVVEQHDEIRRFNFIGDTTHFTGEVTAKRETPQGAVVDVAVRGTNQRDEVTLIGGGSIMLPSRRDGSFELPSPPSALRATAQEMLARHRDIVRTTGPLRG